MTSELYFYLELPDSGEWVTAGRWRAGRLTDTGFFRYAPSYLARKNAVSLDPINLPLNDGADFQAPRYRGLHDALRDAGPDSWGQTLLRQRFGLRENVAPIEYLRHSSNADRWGALAVGSAKLPDVAAVRAPTLPRMAEVMAELEAIARNLPPVRAELRRRLMVGSTGGARPKATMSADARGDEPRSYWILKPRLATDFQDVPLLEHLTHRWASASGLNFAQTVHEPVRNAQGQTLSAVRVLRFDRRAGRRTMCLSGATLVQEEFPGGTAGSRASYPWLADGLRQLGVPDSDLKELFARMIFNGLCGNDDDHLRNHAAVRTAQGWRLSPAFDVVPNTGFLPGRSHLQIIRGSHEYSRQAVLRSAVVSFGFGDEAEAGRFVDTLLARATQALQTLAGPQPGPELQWLLARCAQGSALFA